MARLTDEDHAALEGLVPPAASGFRSMTGLIPSLTGASGPPPRETPASGSSSERARRTGPSTPSPSNCRLLTPEDHEFLYGDEHCLVCHGGYRPGEWCRGCNGVERPGGAVTGVILEPEFLRRARVPARFTNCRIANWTPNTDTKPIEVRGWCASWPPERPFLLLKGAKGQGKTHLALGALRDVWERHGRVGQFWNVTDLLDRYRATYDDDRATESQRDIDEALARCPVLVLDDYGAEKSTEKSMELIYKLIDRRYREAQPLVVTTNAQMDAMDRAVSRLLDTSSTVTLTFRGDDRRLGGAA